MGITELLFIILLGLYLFRRDKFEEVRHGIKKLMSMINENKDVLSEAFRETKEYTDEMIKPVRETTEEIKKPFEEMKVNITKSIEGGDK